MSGIIIRDFEELTIVIEDRNTIWALPKHSQPNVIFHRWYSPLGTWQNWRRFRERMRANKNITLRDCYRLANRWQIQMQGTTRKPTFLKQATLTSKEHNDYDAINLSQERGSKRSSKSLRNDESPTTHA